MPAVTVTLTLRIPPELLSRLDANRSGSRNAWIVSVIEQALTPTQTVPEPPPIPPVLDHHHPDYTLPPPRHSSGCVLPASEEWPPPEPD